MLGVEVGGLGFAFDLAGGGGARTAALLVSAVVVSAVYLPSYLLVLVQSFCSVGMSCIFHVTFLQYMYKLKIFCLMKV